LIFFAKSARSAGNFYCLPQISQICAEFINNIILSTYFAKTNLMRLVISL